MSATVLPRTRWPLRGMNPLYPWSDGQPMAENSLQYRWIVTIQGNLEWLYRDRADVWVGADNLVYPVEGHPEICTAPDVYVAFGVPKEDRGSFNVFEEGGVFPQVVFEVRSPSNTAADMVRKLGFYDQYGAEEYYDFDPKKYRLVAYRRSRKGLEALDEVDGYRSPRLGIQFQLAKNKLVILGPDGKPFLTRQEFGDLVEAETQRAEAEARRAEAASRRAGAAEADVDRLKAKLRAAGIDPDAP